MRANGAAERAAILARVSAALAGESKTAPPGSMTIFEPSARTRSELFAQFAAELAALHGEAHAVESLAELPSVVAAFVEARGLRNVAAQRAPAVEAALASLPAERRTFADGLEPSRLADFEAGAIAAQALLADTGSVVVRFERQSERLLQYLPRTCIVIADASMLHEHLDEHAMAPVFEPARAGAIGEANIITGPSRTADIEKVLVLGAHGPESLVVFVVM